MLHPLNLTLWMATHQRHQEKPDQLANNWDQLRAVWSYDSYSTRLVVGVVTGDIQFFCQFLCEKLQDGLHDDGWLHAGVVTLKSQPNSREKIRFRIDLIQRELHRQCEGQTIRANAAKTEG